MNDEMLCDIMAAAILKSACAQAQCRVSAEAHKWWVYVVHLDDHAHTCPACNWITDEGGVGYPRHFISNESMLTSHRSVLVAHLSAWLSHLHASQDAGESGVGGSSAPIDGDAPTSALSDGSPITDIVLSVASGHDIASIRAD